MSLRNRIFLVFALTFVLSIAALFNWLRSDLLPRYMEAQEDILVDLAHLLAADIARHGLLNPGSDAAQPDPQHLQKTFARLADQRFEAQIYSLLKTQVDVRVYVTDARGIVLFDSDNGRDLGRDNSGWRDIRLTLEGEYGARSSRDDPLFPQGSTMYVSAPITDNDHLVGIVSVGRTTANAEYFLANALPRFALAAVLAVGVALSMAFVLYLWVSRPLQRLLDYARALKSGERLMPPDLGDNEMGRIGTAMADLQRALDGKAYVEDYVQALTHELKSPAAAIAGAAELLSEDMPAEDRQRFLQNLRSESRRLSELVERTLALAAIENQRQLQDPTPVDLAALIREVAQRSLSRREAKRLTLNLDLAEKVIVEGDVFLMAQALDNLLGNAIEHSPIGMAINVRLDANGDIRVQDQGPGIPDYAREKIFDRFFALPRADGRKGTGLGLSFVRQIALLHGGDVWLDLGAPSGTCVALRFAQI